MNTRFTDEQIVGFLRQVDSGDKSVAEVCREGRFSLPTFYVWKRRLGSTAEPEVKRLRELEPFDSAQGEENLRPKRLLAERDLEVDVARELPKKVLGTAERRAVLSFMPSREVSGRRASWWLGLSRSWLGYEGSKGTEDAGLGDRLREVAKAHLRYGVRPLWALVRREGRVVNVKRVRRLCRDLGLL